MKNTFIRNATDEDLEKLLLLLEELFSIEEDFTFNREKQNSGLKMIMNSTASVLLVAEYAGEVIGMCSGQLTISTSEGSKALLVEDVIVEKKYRRQKIATKLLKAVAQWGITRGAHRCQLLADISNKAAFDFYNRIGFQKTQLVALRKYNQGQD